MKLFNHKLLKLDLGCGSSPKHGYIGIDNFYKSKNVIKKDVLLYLKKLPDNSVSEIYSRHFFEHLDYKYIKSLLHQINRVLISGGSILITVPHYSNPFFFSDPTHKTFWGIHSFSYICEETCLRRNVPKYISMKGWSLIDVKVKFVPMKNIKLLGVRMPSLCLILNFIINLNTVLIEYYERYLASFFSIYEIEFLVLKK
jgi:hypothetical protein